MSTIRDKFFADKAVGALWDVAVSMKRGNPLPLDSSSVFDSYASLQAYVADAKTVAYPGQIVAVVNTDSTGIYYLDQNLAIQEVGKIPTADNKSIEIADGVITMHDYGTSYYKYVPEVKDEATGAVSKAAGYEKVEVTTDTPWKAGLEPRVVADNGEFVIGWFEPNPTTIDGVQDQVVAVQGTVEDLDEIINKEGGLVDQVEDLQEEIGHAATETGDAATGLYAELEEKADKNSVYTKEEANGLLNAKANAADVYTKEETKSEIEKAVSAVNHLKRKIVADVAAIRTYINENDDAEQYIFMVPTVYQYTQESNKYDEYIVLSSGEGEEKTYTIEPVGSWTVDLKDYVSETEFAERLKSYYTSAKVDEILSTYATTAAITTEFAKYYTKEQINGFLENYYTEDEIDELLATVYTKGEIDSKFNGVYTTTAVDELLANKVDVVTGKSLVSDTEIAKLATVKENAEENYIKSVSERFSVTEGGQLNLNPLGLSDIDGLETKLGTKADKVYYPVPVVDEDGNPVYEEDGVTPKVEQVEGTFVSPKDKEKLDALVIGDEGVEISGKINAANVEGLSDWVISNRDKVAGLYSTTTDSKVNKAIADLATLTTAVNTNTTNIAAVNTRVDDVITSLTAYVQYTEYEAKMASIDTDINTLKDALTWKAIVAE